MYCLHLIFTLSIRKLIDFPNLHVTQLPTLPRQRMLPSPHSSPVLWIDKYDIWPLSPAIVELSLH